LYFSRVQCWKPDPNVDGGYGTARDYDDAHLDAFTAETELNCPFAATLPMTKKLINDLEPASFGYQGKDVFDESRRANSMMIGWGRVVCWGSRRGMAGRG
jgi:hypothetical protein